MLFIELHRGSHEWRQRHGDLHFHTGEILQNSRKDIGFSWSDFSSVCRESWIMDRSLTWLCALRFRFQSSVSWAGRGRSWRGCVWSWHCCCNDAVTANTDLHRAQCPPQTTSQGTTETHMQNLVSSTTRKGLEVSSLFYLMIMILKIKSNSSL